MQHRLIQTLIKQISTARTFQSSALLSSTTNVYQQLFDKARFKKNNPICSIVFEKHLNHALVTNGVQPSKSYDEFIKHLKKTEIKLTTSVARKLLLNYNCIPAMMDAYPIIEKVIKNKALIMEQMLRMNSIQLIAFCHVISLLDQRISLTEDDVWLLFKNCHMLDWLGFNNFFEVQTNTEYRWTYIKRFLQNNHLSNVDCIIKLACVLTLDELIYVTENIDIKQLQDIQYIFSFNLSNPQKSHIVEVLIDHPQFINSVRNALEMKKNTSYSHEIEAGNIIIGCMNQLLIETGEPISENLSLRKNP